MTNDSGPHDLQHPPPPPPPQPQSDGKTVPQWLRTTIVAGTFAFFLIHVSYDAVKSDYSEFNTSLLLIGFVGTALGFDIMGRK